MRFWSRVLFFCATRARWFMRGSAPFWLMLSRFFLRRSLRDGVNANARRLLGPNASDKQIDRLTQRVLANFYRFVYDLGGAANASLTDLQHQIGRIDGRAGYEALRQQQRGAILVTAHLGSFETGIAAVRRFEPGVHVVFQRDRYEAFNELRHRVHRNLGVHEAIADEGWAMWLRLREALRRDEVVLMQGDRVMPGRRGALVPFCGGHVRLPLGPIKLAALTGAPLVPVFAPRQPDGSVRIIIEPPIEVDRDASPPHQAAEAPPPALVQLGRVIEKHVRAYPEQWLMLHEVWAEDREPIEGSLNHHDGHEGAAPRSNRA